MLRYEVHDGVAELTFSRPDKKLNVLDVATLNALSEGIARAAADPDARAVLLTGEGKAFLAGADISVFPTLRGPAAFEMAGRGQQIAASMEALSKPIVGAINGFALGGGCEIAMACDILYASDQARFGQPEINLGLIPGFGGTQRLARLVGVQRAKELVLSGRMISAEEAKNIGLICEFFANPEEHPSDAPAVFLQKARSLAAELAKKAPFALAQAKRAVQLGADLPLERANELERQAFALCFDTDDQKEGARAFLEKRSAVFTGK